jgi:hypothetical protein
MKTQRACRSEASEPETSYVGNDATTSCGACRPAGHAALVASSRGWWITTSPSRRTRGEKWVAREERTPWPAWAPEGANVEAMLGKGGTVPDDVLAGAVYGWAELMRFTGLGSTGPIELIAANVVTDARTKVAARSFESLGDIALDRWDHDTARARYEEALPLYRQVGNVLGKANCIQGFGDISVAEGAQDDAESKYREALALYERIGEPYSVGGATCGWRAWRRRMHREPLTSRLRARRGSASGGRTSWRNASPSSTTRRRESWSARASAGETPAVQKRRADGRLRRTYSGGPPLSS